MLSLLRRLRLTIASLVLGLSLAACQEQVNLISQVSEQEANEILATLLSAGIDAVKVPGKEGLASITVESGRVAEALQIMRANGLPREQFARMGDVFAKQGLISSPLEERARYIFALSQGLAETVSQIDGVVTARVHVVLPESGSSSTGPLVPSSAAVFIKYKEAYDLESVLPQIKRLVTNSIPNLSYDNVSVVLVPSMQPPPAIGQPDMVSFLGIEVARSSLSLLVILMTVMLLLAFGGIGAAGFLYWTWYLKPKWGQAAANG